MTRVLQVALSLHPGGTERLIVDLATRLHGECPTAVCCLDEAGAWGRELQRGGIRVVALARKPGFRPSLGRLVARVAREHDADVLHAHHYSPFVYSCLARIVRPSCRVIFTEHGRLSDAGPSRKRRVANVALARAAHRVFAVSEDVRAHLIGEGFPPRAVGVIYNGIDIGPAPDPASRTRIRDALQVDPGTVVIGTIARLDPVKDLGTLLRAAAIAGIEARVCLVIIGDGAERPALEALAAAERARVDVRFTGHLDAAREWLAGCDIYANSSITEGISLTILEAMAAALPVVATRVGGTPEVVDESCARLVPPRSPERLAASLTDLARHPPLRRELGASARRRVCERFALDRMIAHYRQAYESV